MRGLSKRGKVQHGDGKFSTTVNWTRQQETWGTSVSEISDIIKGVIVKWIEIVSRYALKCLANASIVVVD